MFLSGALPYTADGKLVTGKVRAVQVYYPIMQQSSTNLSRLAFTVLRISWAGGLVKAALMAALMTLMQSTINLNAFLVTDGKLAIGDMSKTKSRVTNA